MDCLANFGKWDVGVIFGVDDEDAVGVGFVFGQLEADSFVDAAADAVAPDGTLEDFFGDDHGEALVMAGIWRINKGEAFGAEGLAVFVGVFDPAAGMEAVAFG